MIFILILFLPIIIAILIPTFKKVISKEKKICLLLLICNIFIIAFFRLLWPGVSHYANITILFWLNVIVNITLLILLFNSKIKLNKKIAFFSIIIYFICMIFMPIYKFEDHKHTYIDEVETIEEYVNYYNCYGINLSKSKRYY